MSSSTKDPTLDKKHKAILKKMMQLPENKTCADCKGPSPRWASTNLGVFLCIACSGIHRKIGTHISKIRSTTLDVWTAEQVAHFQVIGNSNAAEMYEAHLPPGFQRPPSSNAFSMESFIRNKYERRVFSSPEHASVIATGTLSPSAVRAQAYVASNPRDRSLGLRPEQQVSARLGAYDNLSQPGTGFSSHSYSSQFRTNSHQHGIRSTRQQSSNSWGSSSASRKSPVVVSLLEMGFPEDLAENAAARHGNNLQKAADWVLKQKRVRLYSAPALQTVDHSASSHQTPATESLMDLPSETLDSIQRPNSRAIPKALALESLIGSTGTGSTHNTNRSVVIAATDDDDDFADFGAFESALPNVTKGTSTEASLSNSSTGKSLNDTLAGLYAQGSAKGSHGFMLPTVGIGPFSSSKLQDERSPTVPKNQERTQIATTWKRTNAKNKANNHTCQQTVTSLRVDLLNQKPLTPPPPPLPTLIDANNDAPPPPSPSFSFEIAPALSSRLESAGDSSALVEGYNSQNRINSEISLPIDSEPRQVESEHTPIPEAPDPCDEDPFAFLAKQALSSVTSKKKSGNSVKSVNATFADTNSRINKKSGDISSASTGTNTAPNTTSGFSFEDLLG